MTFDRRRFLLSGSLLGLASALGLGRAPSAAEGSFPFTLTDAEWQARLSPAAYQVLRHEDTERPFTSTLNNEKRAGVFHCAGCDQPLFESAKKYDSGTGWPSFWDFIPGAIGTRECIDSDIRLSDIPDSYLVNRIDAKSSTLRTRTQVGFIPYCDVNFGDASALSEGGIAVPSARTDPLAGPLQHPICLVWIRC